jgi:hypothetical protein
MSRQQTSSGHDLNKPYEENVIGLRGITYFAIVLALLIIVTFGLMWALLNVLNDYAQENAPPANPMAMSDRERLPPEPRLQSAPGFGVEAPGGHVNLELREPQAEYRELRKMWADIWEHGEKDRQTGAVSALPIEAAKERLLSQAKPVPSPGAENLFKESTLFVSDASSGRIATVRRR